MPDLPPELAMASAHQPQVQILRMVQRAMKEQRPHDAATLVDAATSRMPFLLKLRMACSEHIRALEADDDYCSSIPKSLTARQLLQEIDDSIMYLLDPYPGNDYWWWQRDANRKINTFLDQLGLRNELTQTNQLSPKTTN